MAQQLEAWRRGLGHAHSDFILFYFISIYFTLFQFILFQFNLIEFSAVQSGTEQLEAWRHGLASDGDLEWLERFAQLKLYAMTKGDTHVGYWDWDDPDLGRWTAAQRTAHADGRLAADRRVAYLNASLALLSAELMTASLQMKPLTLTLCSSLTGTPLDN